METWFVYIIQTESGKLYTGITNDLERRYLEHSETRKGARFFRLHKPEKIVYKETHPSRSSASKREWEIKQMSRQEKLALFEIKLPADDKALLAECRIETFRAQGRGGQHVNVTDSAVRLTHLPTGIVATSQKERSQYLNKRECISKLRAKVKELNQHKKPRTATRKPQSVKEREKSSKIRASSKKRLRRPPAQEDS